MRYEQQRPYAGQAKPNTGTARRAQAKRLTCADGQAGYPKIG